jgi:predicted Zn-dependent peptidase
MMRNMITTKGGLSEERISTASSELTDAFIYGRDYTVKEYSEKVCATTADDIMRVAKKFFTKNNFCFSYVVPNGKGGKDGEN